MATATPRIDGSSGFVWSIREAEDGADGVQNWIVDTTDFALALLAAGLPRLGEAYSSEFPTLTCREREVHELGWGDAVGEGHVRVECRYRTPNSGGTIDPGIGNDYTVPRPVQGSVQVLYGINESRQIGNGAGAPKFQGYVDFEAHAFRTKGDFIQNNGWQQALVALLTDPRVNDGTVRLPPLLGIGFDVTFSAGQLLLTDYSYQPHDQQGLVEVVMGFSARVDHLVRWRLQDADGNAVGDEQATAIYAQASFAGLPL